MDFFKKNYEKLLLGIVLLGLVVAVGALPVKINQEKTELGRMTGLRINKQPKPLAKLDLSLQDVVLKRASEGLIVNFDEPNHLFNPIQWLKPAQGPIIPSRSAGPGRLTVTNFVPLYLRLSLDSVIVSEAGTRYMIGVVKETGATIKERIKRQIPCSINTKNDTFSLSQANGPTENPTNVVVELNDTGERVIVSKDQGWRRIDGYSADFKYAPENMNSRAARVGTVLNFNSEAYKIVALTTNEVVLLATSNQKNWRVKINTQSE